MRRSRLVTVLGGILTAALLLPSAAGAGTAPSGAAAVPSVVVAPSVAVAPAIKLGCALVIPAPTGTRPRIVCRWSALEGAAVAEYRAWRRVDGGPARLIATVAPTAPLRHADFAIRPGHTYTYRIVARAADGTRLGASARVSVRVGRTPEALRFNCFYKIDAAVEGVACRWAASTRPAAVRYVLFRSVDGAAREAVYRTPLNGPRSFLDTDVGSGQRIRYAVVALSVTGRVVGLSRVDAVLVP
jgi:hypothetical protein